MFTSVAEFDGSVVERKTGEVSAHCYDEWMPFAR